MADKGLIVYGVNYLGGLLGFSQSQLQAHGINNFLPDPHRLGQPVNPSIGGLAEEVAITGGTQQMTATEYQQARQQVRVQNQEQINRSNPERTQEFTLSRQEPLNNIGMSLDDYQFRVNQGRIQELQNLNPLLAEYNLAGDLPEENKGKIIRAENIEELKDYEEQKSNISDNDNIYQSQMVIVFNPSLLRPIGKKFRYNDSRTWPFYMTIMANHMISRIGLYSPGILKLDNSILREIIMLAVAMRKTQDLQKMSQLGIKNLCSWITAMIKRIISAKDAITISKEKLDILRKLKNILSDLLIDKVTMDKNYIDQQTTYSVYQITAQFVLIANCLQSPTILHTRTTQTMAELYNDLNFIDMLQYAQLYRYHFLLHSALLYCGENGQMVIRQGDVISKYGLNLVVWRMGNNMRIQNGNNFTTNVTGNMGQSQIQLRIQSQFGIDLDTQTSIATYTNSIMALENNANSDNLLILEAINSQPERRQVEESFFQQNILGRVQQNVSNVFNYYLGLPPTSSDLGSNNLILRNSEVSFANTDSSNMLNLEEEKQQHDFREINYEIQQKVTPPSSMQKNIFVNNPDWESQIEEEFKEIEEEEQSSLFIRQRDPYEILPEDILPEDIEIKIYKPKYKQFVQESLFYEGKGNIAENVASSLEDLEEQNQQDLNEKEVYDDELESQPLIVPFNRTRPADIHDPKMGDILLNHFGVAFRKVYLFLVKTIPGKTYDIYQQIMNGVLGSQDSVSAMRQYLAQFQILELPTYLIIPVRVMTDTWNRVYDWSINMLNKIKQGLPGVRLSINSRDRYQMGPDGTIANEMQASANFLEFKKKDVIKNIQKTYSNGVREVREQRTNTSTITILSNISLRLRHVGQQIGLRGQLLNYFSRTGLGVLLFFILKYLGVVSVVGKYLHLSFPTKSTPVPAAQKQKQSRVNPEIIGNSEKEEALKIEIPKIRRRKAGESRRHEIIINTKKPRGRPKMNK